MMGSNDQPQKPFFYSFNLAYRWFCRPSIEDKVPDHSTFSKNRHGRFREAEAFRFVFEKVLQRCQHRSCLNSGMGTHQPGSIVIPACLRGKSTS